MRKILFGIFASIALVLTVGVAHAASPVVVYNSIPDPIPGNVPSVGFEATSTSEFGGQVGLASTERVDPKITVLMSSWGCEDGNWFSQTCVTTPGATFSHSITLNVYNVGTGDSVGSLITTKTQSFDIPYRPSADNTNCTGADAGKWSNGSACFNGYATPITFDLTGTTLPDKVIIGVAYNTTHYGSSPIGEAAACFSESGGCGYDSLNVGTAPSATVGSVLPTANDAYQSSTWTGAYCDNGVGGIGTFRLDAGCWTGFIPTFKIEANAPEKVLVGKATGGLTLKGPKQQISFNAFDYGVSMFDQGTVEYQNFEYPGGLHYTADLVCANVKKTTSESWFAFQIPAGFPGLSGLYVVSYVKDGGTPGTKGDVYGHTATGDLATAKSWCENASAPIGNYTVTGGNAVVHK